MKLRISKNNVILLVFLGIAATYLAYMLYTIIKQSNKYEYEHFTTPPLDKDSVYNSRLNVLKIFNSVLNRKPTPEEITNYANKYTNEQDLLVVIMKDFNIQSDSKDQEQLASKSNDEESQKESFVGAVAINRPTTTSKSTTYASPIVQQECPFVDTKTIEASLSEIVNQVNAIRGIMYTQTVCQTNMMSPPAPTPAPAPASTSDSASLASS